VESRNPGMGGLQRMGSEWADVAPMLLLIHDVVVIFACVVDCCFFWTCFFLFLV
jgi:hypothetical protein